MQIDFVKLVFDAETDIRLFDFCMHMGLGIADIEDHSALTPDDFKFHVTVIYSRVANESFQEAEFEVSKVLRPAEYALFGPGKDILVIRLHDDPYLQSLHEHYRTTYGHVSDFELYQPHVTIKGAKTIPTSFPMFDLRTERLIHKRKVL